MNRFTLFTTWIALATSGHGQSFEERQKTAGACFKEKDYECVEKELRKAIKSDPEHPNVYIAWSDIGTALRRSGKGDEAMKAYDKALELKPGDAEVLKNRASLKRSRGDLQGSLADYDAAIASDPGNSNAYMERANTRSRLGDEAGEEADLIKAVELDASDYKAATNLAIIKKKQKRYDEALADLNALVRQHPSEAILWNNRADLLLAMGGDLEKALQDIEQAMKVDPKYANAWVTRAEIYLALGRKQEAKADLEKAVAMGVESESVQDLLSQCE